MWIVRWRHSWIRLVVSDGRWLLREMRALPCAGSAAFASLRRPLNGGSVANSILAYQSAAPAVLAYKTEKER